jgi:predicted acylesterase/phospholipase RssA
LRRASENNNIENLWLPYFCVSASLSSNRAIVHESGPLWKSIRASVGLPGILPPTISDGELLIDGGLINNLPVDVMTRKNVGKVIALDLLGDRTRNFSHITALPTLGDVIKQRVKNSTVSSTTNPANELPNVLELLFRASLVGSAYHAERNRMNANLYLNPPVHDFGLLEFKSFEKVVTVGYNHTKQVLDRNLRDHGTIWNTVS